MRRSLFALLLALLPASLAAQRPGEIAGRVAEAGTDAPLEMAAVEVPELGIRVWTDGGGRFLLRGVEAGPHRLRITRAGYAGRSAEVQVRNGEQGWISISLAPTAVVLDAVTATGTRDVLREGSVVTRTEIERTGARTAADVVARAPGVVVREAGPTGARTISIRGSGADAVLVLVDGAPLNDPVSGEADLGAVPAQSIERVTVLAGAHSARYGPGAEAGVVLIDTRAGEVTRAAELSAGTLGERAGRGEWGALVGRMALQAGAHARAVDGEFRYERDPADPTVVRRGNADQEEAGAFAALSGPLAGGELRLRGGWEGLHRGLAGTGHTPSLHSRQWMQRGRASLSWRRGPTSALLSGAVQRARYADPDPPFGLPYDDTTRVRMLNARLETSASLGGSRRAGVGFDGLVQRIEAALSERAPRTLAGGGVFGHLADEARVLGRTLSLSAGGRVDRDGVGGRWYASRALAVGMDVGPFRVQAANRSAFTPPTLGDQFFREGVGIEPNPDLRPERVPNEWELGVSTARVLGGTRTSFYATAYDSDVRGMIVWMRRFNDRWSPANADAHRRGMDVRLEVAPLGADLRVDASYSLARITYDRAEDDDVQVVYRPRHTASLGGEWGAGPWRAVARARYTGARNPTPTTANVIPGYWATQLRVSRGWRAGAWEVTTALDVDRALDEKGFLIAGYPEPGRRARLDVRVVRTQSPSRK